ncbi:flippase [uncultured Desulfosarcina sp.]|uniref:flippase n=1 Tax=uncultured Desulfosarcina sp. TaxID=218289 RepID=UPI0029C81A4F|nr:flippase [uncultured Desulfosarcina sp.]
MQNNNNEEKCEQALGEHDHNLTSGRRITRNSILNIFGYCAPMVVALLTIPVIVRGMGIERFGILTLAWAVIGYFSLFDFGLNRALTKMVAEKLGTSEQSQIPYLVWTSLVVMALFGLLVAAALIVFLPWIVDHVLTISSELRRETQISFYLLACSVPIVILSVGLRGVLSAYQKFDLINWVRVPMGIYVFVAPIPIIKWYSNALHPVLAALIAGRLLAILIQLKMCTQIVSFMKSGIGFRRDLVRPLLSYGGWITVCNVISPLMIYIDRFFIGSLISTAAVAFYATPNEVATKLWMLPWALLGVLFPAFSTSLVRDLRLASELFSNSLKYLFVILFPIILVSITYSFEGLDFWLGREFAEKSSIVLRWMLVGVFLHGIAQVPYALLQGAGRPDILAKLHMIELPLYCFLLWQLITLGGTKGAAIAWTMRLGADGLIVFLFAGKILPEIDGKIHNQLRILAMALLCFIVTAYFENVFYKSCFCLAVILSFAWFVWFIIFNDQDRDRISRRFLNAI